MGTERAPGELDRLLGERLRGVREAQRMSLHDVEARSRGTLRAVAVGSWERGERRIPVSKLARIAKFYGVPAASLLPDDSAADDAPVVLEEFPSELSLSRDGWGRHVLLIDGPGLQGSAVSTSRELVLAIAEAYAAMRREQRSAA